MYLSKNSVPIFQRFARDGRNVYDMFVGSEGRELEARKTHCKVGFRKQTGRVPEKAGNCLEESRILRGL